MIEIVIGTDDLARVRFTTDPIWEATASLHSRSCAESARFHRPLLERFPSDPAYDFDLLLTLSSADDWVPDLLAPAPVLPTRDPASRLGDIATTPIEVVERDLVALRALAPASRAAAMGADELRTRTAEAMVAYWHDVLDPIWERVGAIAEGDISYRLGELATVGLGPMLDAVNHRMTYSGDRIRIDLAVDERIESVRGGFWLVPSVFRFPGFLVLWESDLPVLSYGARGAGRLWEHDPGPSDVLAALLGRSRARVLAILDVPATTTELASRLDLSAATVSVHLKALTGPGLLRHRRIGRRVVYERTELGDQLVTG